MPDVVDLIMKDHREVERLFEQLKSDPASRPGLLPVLTTLLTAHSRAEESDVYPAAAQAGGADDVAHSQEEHVEADELLEQLAATDPESPDFEEVLQKVVDSVSHHIEEEESTVLPHMRQNMETGRLDELGQAFLDARAKHLGEQPDDITKEQLQQQAANAQVSGTSGLSKSELQDKLREEASEE